MLCFTDVQRWGAQPFTWCFISVTGRYFVFTWMESRMVTGTLDNPVLTMTTLDCSFLLPSWEAPICLSFLGWVTYFPQLILMTIPPAADLGNQRGFLSHSHWFASVRLCCQFHWYLEQLWVLDWVLYYCHFVCCLSSQGHHVSFSLPSLTSMVEFLPDLHTGLPSTFKP